MFYMLFSLDRNTPLLNGTLLYIIPSASLCLELFKCYLNLISSVYTHKT